MKNFNKILSLLLLSSFGFGATSFAIQNGDEQPSRKREINDTTNNKRTHAQCAICFDNITQEQEVQLHCGHSFCQNCLTTIVNNANTEHTLAHLRCPNTNCNQPFNSDDIRAITNDEQLVTTHTFWICSFPFLSLLRE